MVAYGGAEPLPPTHPEGGFAVRLVVYRDGSVFRLALAVVTDDTFATKVRQHPEEWSKRQADRFWSAVASAAFPLVRQAVEASPSAQTIYEVAPPVEAAVAAVDTGPSPFTQGSVVGRFTV